MTDVRTTPHPTIHDGIFAEKYVKAALNALGVNLENENFKDTPNRWVRFLSEFMCPYDPAKHLDVGFAPVLAKHGTEESRYDNALVVQSAIPYQAVCAHHLVPVLGRAAVGYIPTKRVVGLSKLTRLVWGISHRSPSLQEDVGNLVADALVKHLEPLGAICVIKAEHGCMACRGVAQQGVLTTTSSLRGVFTTEGALRNEFYTLAGI